MFQETSSHPRLPLGQVFRKHPAGRMLRGVEPGEVGWRLGGRGSAGAPAGVCRRLSSSHPSLSKAREGALERGRAGGGGGGGRAAAASGGREAAPRAAAPVVVVVAQGSSAGGRPCHLCHSPPAAADEQEAVSPVPGAPLCRASVSTHGIQRGRSAPEREPPGPYAGVKSKHPGFGLSAVPGQPGCAPGLGSAPAAA